MIGKLDSRVAQRNYLDEESTRQTIVEITHALNRISDQWNDYVYPVISSLPGQGNTSTDPNRRVSIDTVQYGMDGSQVYMDMAATPYTDGGMFHDGTRQKTIKEVVKDTYQDSLARISKLESLLTAINSSLAGGGLAYDDTELRNWLLQLAGDSVGDGIIGSTYDPLNFASAPAKSVDESLHQRDNNFRIAVGIDSLGYAATDISSLFAGTTNLTADTNVVDALVTLDGLVGAGAGTLQTAYNGGDTILVTAASGTESNPVILESPAATVGQPALSNRGSLAFRDDAASIENVAILMNSGYVSQASVLNSYFELYHRQDNTNVAGSDDERVLNLESVIDVGSTTSTSTMELGVRGSGVTGERYATLRGGYSTSSADWGWVIEGVSTGAGHGANFDTNGTLSISSQDGNLEFSSFNQDLNMNASAGNVGINCSGYNMVATGLSVWSTNATTWTDIDGISITATDELDLTAGALSTWATAGLTINNTGATGITVNSSAAIFASTSAGNIAFDAADQFRITASALSTWNTEGIIWNDATSMALNIGGLLDISSIGLDIDAGSAAFDITATSDSTISVTGTTQDLTLDATGRITVNAQNNFLLNTSVQMEMDIDFAGGGSQFLMYGGAVYPGQSLLYTSKLSQIRDFSATDGIGTEFVTSFIAGTTYGSFLTNSTEMTSGAGIKTPVRAMQATMGAYGIESYSYSEDPYALFRDNVVKARCRIILPDTTTVYPGNIINDATAEPAFNVQETNVGYVGGFSSTHSTFTITYTNALEIADDVPTVTATVQQASGTYVYAVSVISSSLTSATIAVSRMRPAVGTWESLDTVSETVNIHIQVI